MQLIRFSGAPKAGSLALRGHRMNGLKHLEILSLIEKSPIWFFMATHEIYTKLQFQSQHDVIISFKNKAILEHCQNNYFCPFKLAKQAEADVNLTRIGSDPQILRCKSTMEIDIIATRTILGHFALLNRNCILMQILDSICSRCCFKLCTRKLLVHLRCKTML